MTTTINRLVDRLRFSAADAKSRDSNEQIYPMLQFTKIIVIVVAFGVISNGVGAAELRLRSDARPQGGVVRLGDVADIFAAADREVQTLGEIELVPAPAPGKQRTLSVREIQDTLERRGLNMLQYHISGASQVIVVGYAEPVAKPIPKSKTLPFSSIQEARRAAIAAVVRYLQQASGSDDPWTVDVDLTDVQTQAILADIHHVEARGGQQPWVGKQKFDIEVRGEKGPAVFSVDAQVGMPSAVVVTAKAVPRGSILQASDVTLERTKPGTQIGDAFQSMDDVVGREAVLAIAPGQILDPQYIRTPLLVKRGSVVTVNVVAPGVKIRTQARARENGSAGESITVESLVDRKSYLARVMGIDQVEVTATPAATTAEEPAVAKTETTAARKSAARTRVAVTRPQRADDADSINPGTR